MARTAWILASREPGEDGYFLLTLTAGEELAKTVEAMDYVFVLDRGTSSPLADALGRQGLPGRRHPEVGERGVRQADLPPGGRCRTASRSPGRSSDL